MFEFNAYGKQFKIELVSPPGWIDTSVRGPQGLWEDVPGWKDDPDIILQAKTKDEAITLLKEALSKIATVLRELYSGDTTEPEKEPDDVWQYIAWVIDNHVEWVDGEFVIKTD